MTGPKRIPPRTLKGFRDHLPAAMLRREQVIEIARRVFRSYGFAPIDTPALEYLEILTGKGGEESDKQLYQFEDHGGRMVGLRFDLTVPLARYVAQHHQELGMPCKRYHIAPVWRGENTQHGRFREFTQCDFDTIGTRNVAADLEIVLVIHDLLRAIGFERFTIHINNRLILNGLLEKLEVGEHASSLLRVLDKLAKIGADAVADEMVNSIGISRVAADQILEMAALEGSSADVLAGLGPLVSDSTAGGSGIAQLTELLAGVEAAGVPAERIQLDVSIARGLDYYTGVVFETLLDDEPEIGSVCSGGRYDNLAGVYSSQELPGVGASLGLDRLLEVTAKHVDDDSLCTPADVLIAYFSRDRLHDYLRIAAALRAAGIGAELYPEPKKLGKQLQYADRRGFPIALIAGDDEFRDGSCQLKLLASGESVSVPLEPTAASIVAELSRRLNRATRQS